MLLSQSALTTSTMPGKKTGSVDRRKFLYLLAGLSSALVFGKSKLLGQNLSGLKPKEDVLAALIAQAPLAKYWVSSEARKNCLACHSSIENTEKKYSHPDRPVQCQLCANNCIINQGERGKCQARINIDGKLYSLVYGRPMTAHIDPIEKKPFFHFLPGHSAYSLATSGCPLRCRFCQNWTISQAKPEDYQQIQITPDEIVAYSISRSTDIIAFTYNEPTVFTEYLLDIARSGHQQGLRSVMISCGYMNEIPLGAICANLDAIKIDLKGFSNDFYREVCQAELEPVLRSIRQAAAAGIHLEIVNLVVPTLNDSNLMLGRLIDWIGREAGPDVPLHFTRFHPDYQMRNLPPTPIATLEKAYQMARDAGLHYPYIGNVPGHAGNSTYCPHCGALVIKRSGFFVLENLLINGNCPVCQSAIKGVWS